jgi:hypothetical protein
MLNDIPQGTNNTNNESEQGLVSDLELKNAYAQNNLSIEDVPKPKKSAIDVILLVIQVAILLIAVCQLLFAVLPYITGQNSTIVSSLTKAINRPDYSINSYLKNKYGLEKNDYSIVSEINEDIYILADKDGKKFHITNYGSKSQPNYMDNYQQIQFEADVIKILSSKTDLKIAYMYTDYELNSRDYDKLYNRDAAAFIKSENYPKKTSYPFRLWVYANDSNYQSILEKIKVDISGMSDAIGQGIKIYEIKETYNDFSVDYIWNEKSEFGGHSDHNYQYIKTSRSKDPFYYVVLYNKSGKSNFIIDAKTENKEYYWGNISS